MSSGIPGCQRVCRGGMRGRDGICKKPSREVGERESVKV